MYPSLTVIFPTFNGFNDTKKCLNSINKIHYPRKKLQIIVVDNHSSDQTPERIRKNFPSIRLIQLGNNFGFARAVNIAAKVARGDLLFITNNDVAFRSDYLEKLVSFILSNPRIGACGGMVITKRFGRKYPDGAANISRFTSQVKRLKNYHQIQEVDFISGSGLLTKRYIFKLLGGFDTKFPFYFEDLDLCLRIKKLGLEVIYYPKAVMYHQQSSTASKMPEKWLTNVWYQGKVRIVTKHFVFWSKPMAVLAQMVFCLSVILRRGNFEPLFSFIKALETIKLFGGLFSDLKKRQHFDSKKIINYYSQGDIYTARNSAPFQQIVLKHFYTLLGKNHQTKNWHVLEFGVGHGWNLSQMVKFFGKITGMDIAKAAILESGEYGFKNVELRLIKGQLLPFADQTFDLVVATEVLEHVPDLEKTARELKRVTKQGGYILVSVPTYLNLRGISKRIIEAKFGPGTWEPARSHPGGYEQFLTPGKILSFFKDLKIIETHGADYGTAWSLPRVPFYPKLLAPFFEITLGKFPPLKRFGMNFYFLAKKLS